MSARERAGRKAMWKHYSGVACSCPTSSQNAATRAGMPERTAINAPMQGTAADIKEAMLAVAAWLRDSGLHKMIMQVLTNWCLKCRRRS